MTEEEWDAEEARILLMRRVMHLRDSDAGRPPVSDKLYKCIVCGEVTKLSDYATTSAGQAWDEWERSSPSVRCCDVYGLPDPRRKR